MRWMLVEVRQSFTSNTSRDLPVQVMKNKHSNPSSSAGRAMKALPPLATSTIDLMDVKIHIAKL